MKVVVVLLLVGVGTASADTQTSYKAELQANHADIDPRSSAPIKRVAVHDGQFVAKGDTLVELDDTQARATLAAAKAALAVKRAELAAAESVVTSDHSELAKAKRDLADAKVKSAQVALELAEMNVGYTMLRAELGGMVTLRTLGSSVERFHTIGTITDIDHAWVEGTFTEPQAAAIKSGQVADIAIGKLTIHGTVDHVNLEDAKLMHEAIDGGAFGSNARVGVHVKIALDKPDRGLTPGTFAIVTIHTK